MSNNTIHIGMMLALGIICASTVFAATQTLRPSSQGTYAEWSPKGTCLNASNTTHYTCVDEAIADTGDWLQIATSGKKESFGFTDLTNVSNGSNSSNSTNITSLQFVYYARQVSASAKNFQTLVRIGSTDYSLGNHTTNATYGIAYHTAITNPATGVAWTVTDVNALQAGMIASGTNPGGRVAQMYVVVTYS